MVTTTWGNSSAARCEGGGVIETSGSSLLGERANLGGGVSPAGPPTKLTPDPGSRACRGHGSRMRNDLLLAPRGGCAGSRSERRKGCLGRVAASRCASGIWRPGEPVSLRRVIRHATRDLRDDTTRTSRLGAHPSGLLWARLPDEPPTEPTWRRWHLVQQGRGRNGEGHHFQLECGRLLQGTNRSLEFGPDPGPPAGDPWCDECYTGPRRTPEVQTR